jgi:FtsP/CotA-like multicopper oxidase with cupredoxin domain
MPSGTSGDFVTPTPATVNGAIKCQQISGGDGYSTMGDGNQIFMFSFGPLSGLADIAAGRPSTQFPNIFNTPYSDVSSIPLVRGDPATTDGAVTGATPYPGFSTATATSPNFTPPFTWNGAVGLTPDIAYLVTVSNLVDGLVTPALYPGATVPGCPTTAAAATALGLNINNIVTAWTDAPLGIPVGQQVLIFSASSEGGNPTPLGYAGTWTISCVATGAAVTPDGFNEYAFQYTDTNTGLAADTGNDLAATAGSPAALDGHVDPRPIMDVGVMNGNIPAPLAAFDEDDEFFLTLTNVGMIMRPDLFEQHTVHFHGYPNASSFYDGVPDASVAINIGASFTYYYLAPDAGTYFWHCHITPPEHLQMGMVGQLYVRPRQDRVPLNGDLYTYLGYQNGYQATLVNGVLTLPTSGLAVDQRTACNPANDILCSATMPSIRNTTATGKRPGPNTLCNGTALSAEGTTPEYVYNDGDGSSCYDVTYPIQMHGFDPNFHFVGMTFNPEMFVDMKDKYFLLNGRSYPDTVAPGPQATVSSDGQMHYSQPLPAIVNIPVGGKASLRLVNLSVSEYHTLQSLGVPMHVVGWNAKLLRDQDGNSTEYYTNSITLGGGESADVILDASDDGCSAYLGTGCAAHLYKAGNTFYVYSSNLDHLSNDAENFGGMMTEVHICNSVTSDTFGNTCN